MKKWFQEHAWANRAVRTFFQAAVGVIAAAVTDAAGVVHDINIQAAIVLAVSTGLAAVMNMGGREQQ